MAEIETAEDALLRRVSLKMERLERRFSILDERMALLEMDNATLRLRVARLTTSRVRKGKQT